MHKSIKIDYLVLVDNIEKPYSYIETVISIHLQEIKMKKFQENKLIFNNITNFQC